jgi:hypothetical protein
MRGFRQLPLNGDQDDSLVSGTPLGECSERSFHKGTPFLAL